MELPVRLSGRYWGSAHYRRFDNGVSGLAVRDEDESGVTLVWTNPQGMKETRKFGSRRGALLGAARIAGVSVRNFRMRGDD